MMDTRYIFKIEIPSTFIDGLLDLLEVVVKLSKLCLDMQMKFGGKFPYIVSDPV